jgi:hypothetical protein
MIDLLYALSTAVGSRTSFKGKTHQISYGSIYSFYPLCLAS